MIKSDKEVINSVLETLRASVHTFTLTGSRAWGTESLTSDWDFFVQNSLDVCVWLENVGFKKDNNARYSDDGNCVCVYSYKKPKAHSIHIQCVKDAVLKESVQNILLKSLPDGFPNKTTAKLIWKVAFDIFKSKDLMCIGCKD